MRKIISRSDIQRSGVLWKCMCSDCVKARPERAELRVFAKEMIMADIHFRDVEGASNMRKEAYLAYRRTKGET